MAVATNGTDPVPAVLAADADAIGATTDVVVNGLRALATAQAERIERLTAELADARHQLKAYGSALGALTGERPPEAGAKRGPKPKSKPKQQSIGGAKLALIEQTIRERYGDGSEFRQVDIRNVLEGVTSSVTAVAFGALRERELIRLARKDGNNLYFRLTRSALADE